MNDGVIRIVFSLVYVSLKEFGVVGSDMYTWGIKDFHMEKEMATHSSILAWEISWTEKPGGLQFMGSQKSWTQLSD